MARPAHRGLPGLSSHRLASSQGSVEIGSSVTNVLFLAHRIPYPPNKGDKIRSYHLLRHLAGKHRIFLGSFVDDPDDWQYRSALEGLCAEVCLRPLSPLRATVRSARGMLSGEALTLPYYRDAGLRGWVDATMARERIEHVVVYSSSMAQYCDQPRYTHCRRVLDVVDVDSDKWRQYSEHRSFPFSWIYRREARALLAYERDVAARFDATLFVSEAEAALFRRLAPEVASKVGHYNNGVDTQYFDPAARVESPYPPGGPVVVFTGAMDYWANADAVSWFADEVMPRLRTQRADLRFYIVGSKPTEAVLALGRRPAIVVTGRVSDVRPFLQHAALAVAPLRVARGIQNKVLEALAMERLVVCTPAAAEGLEPAPWMSGVVHEDADGFAGAVLARLGENVNSAGRDYVRRHYSWDSHLVNVDRLLGLP